MSPVLDPSGVFLIWANEQTLWLLAKWGYIILFGLYFLFSLVVLTQIRQMLISLNGQLDKAILLLGIIQIVLAIAALVAAIVIL